MNSKQKKVYQRICKNPVQSDIEWKDIEKFLESLGAKISEGNASRVRIELKGEMTVFRRLHPEKVTDEGSRQRVEPAAVQPIVRFRHFAIAPVFQTRQRRWLHARCAA